MDENNLNETNEMEKSNKTNNNSLSKYIISAIIGILIGGLLVFLLTKFEIIRINNNTIATFNGGKVTQNQFYNHIKTMLPISYALEIVDKSILENKYTLTEEQVNEIREKADSIISMYEKYYGYTEENFLSGNGFKSKDEFINYLKLDYMRDLYCTDYFKESLISQEEIQKYYEENVYGEINTKHMLVAIEDGTDATQSETMAKEIIGKLNSGTSFEDVANEYAEKIKFEEVDFDNFSASDFEEAYINASLSLEKGNYTKEPVKTSYGYHVIYVADKKDKPQLADIENDIVKELSKPLEKEDENIRYKALIKMREDYKINFIEETYKKAYEDYCNQVNA